MKDAWYYTRLGRTIGPVSFDDIVESVRGRTLTASDKIRQGTNGEWVRADSIHGLFDEDGSPIGAEALDSTLEVAEDFSDLNIVFSDNRSPQRGNDGADEAVDEEARLLESILAPSSAPSRSRSERESRSPADGEFELTGTFETSSSVSAARPRSSKSSGQASKPGRSPALSSSPKPAATGSPAAEDAIEWYSRAMGLEFGPMPFADLIALASNGALGPEDTIRPGSDGPWIPAVEVSELAAIFGTASASAPVGTATPTAPAAPAGTAAPAGASGTGAAAGRSLPTTVAASAPPRGNAPQPAAAPRQPMVAAAGPMVGSVAPGTPGATSVVTINGQTFVQVAVRGPDGRMQTVLAPLQAGGQPMAGAPMAAVAVAVPVAVPVAMPPGGEAGRRSASPPILDTDDDEDGHDTDEDEDEKRNRKEEEKQKRDSERWYCRINGEEHGPLEFRYLRKTALAGRLAPSDEVRRGKKGAWVPASTVPVLFETEEQESGGIDLEKLASQSAGPAPVQSVGSQGAGAAGPSRDVDQLIRQAQKTAFQAAPVKEEREPITLASIVDQLKQNTQLLVVLGFLLLGAAWWFIPRKSGDARDVLVVADVYKQFAALRDKKAGATEWKELDARIEKEVKPILDRLDAKKPAPGSASAFLHKALKESFFRMQKSSRSNPTQEEDSFVAYFNRALLTAIPDAERIRSPNAPVDPAYAGSAAPAAGPP